MGVKVRLVVYAPDEKTAARACSAAFARIAGLEDMMSDYRPTSELMRLCARAGGPPVRVSDDLWRVLVRARQVARRSRGAFDISVGPLVQLWRAARKSKTLPAPADLQNARALVGWRHIRLDARHQTVQLRVRNMRLDLGGIAKGYAGDCALVVLRQHGIRRALFEGGGDIVLGEAPPDARGWKVEVANPGPLPTRTLTVANCAVSTSGDTQQWIEIKGRRYSHIVDPRTGLGLTDRIAATIIAPDGLTSDSLSTAVCVLGAQKSRKLLKKYPGATAHIRRVD